MRLPKNNLASKIALYYENSKRWHPFSGFAVLLKILLRKKYSSGKEVFVGVPVYFLEVKKDLSLAWTLLKGSEALLNELAPFWAKQVKKVFNSILISDIGPMIQYDRRDRSWTVNVLKIRSSSREKQIIILSMNLITTLCVGILDQGHLGYFGVKNCKSITYRAVARFLRKCNSDGISSEFLYKIYLHIDAARPGRNCYQRFQLEESLKGRPGGVDD